MAETTAQPPAGITREVEEAGFYHEAALNASWTGARLALGGLTFGLGSFVFAFFYLRSLNSHNLWYPAGFHGPQAWVGGAWLALVLGLAAIGIQIWQLTDLPFFPGASGFASCFVGFYPVFLTIVFCAMVWLETLIMRVRSIPEMAFVEQPPTYAEAFAVQRFQASLSAFTVVWNYLAVSAVIAWVLFYLVH